VTGRYYDGTKEQALAPNARDARLADALWVQAEELVGLDAAARMSDGTRTAG
jgi:hypothetical protein